MPDADPTNPNPANPNPSNPAVGGVGDPKAPVLMKADSEFDLDSLPEEHRVPISRRKLESFAQVAESFANLEKMVGVDTVEKPVNGKLGDWLGQHKAELGVPEKAEAYVLPKIELPKGVEIDKEMIGRAQAFAHQNNIPQDLFSTFAGFIVKERLDDIGRLDTQMTAAEQTAQTELKGKWGKEFDDKIELAKLAARSLGYDNKFLDKLSNGFGASAMAEHFATIGGMMDDAKLKTGDGGGLPNDAIAAKREIETLKQDTQFQATLSKKTAPGHKEARAKWDRLHEVAGAALLPSGGQAA